MPSFSPAFVIATVLIFGGFGSAAMAQDTSQQPAPAAQAQADPQTPPAPPADQPARHAPNPRREARHIAKQLGLSHDQQSRIEPILANREQQVASVRADTTLAPQDRRAKLMGIRQDAESQIDAVLTDAQKQQWQQIKAQHHAQAQNAPANG